METYKKKSVRKYLLGIYPRTGEENQMKVVIIVILIITIA